MSSCCHDKSRVSSSASHTSSELTVEHSDELGGACCPSHSAKKTDYLLTFSLSVVVLFYPLQWLLSADGYLLSFSQAIYEILNSMFFGLVFGVVMVAVLSKVPREFVMSLMGSSSGRAGILRAVGAGLLLDLCSHGILMVGAKLYERGASLGQVMAFLIASPWNSLSLTFVLVAFIGLTWTLIYIALSVVIALIAGVIFDFLVKSGALPGNPNTETLSEDFQFWPEAKGRLKNIRWSIRDLPGFVVEGLRESRVVIRWLFAGVIIASLVRTFVPADLFGTYFGPTVLGLAVTLGAATVIEVCSEGAAPIAADIFSRAAAPGNSFAFLMAGVATDYTEIVVLREVTHSWRIAFALPFVVLPQVVVLSLLLNQS